MSMPPTWKEQHGKRKEAWKEQHCSTSRAAARHLIRCSFCAPGGVTDCGSHSPVEGSPQARSQEGGGSKGGRWPQQRRRCRGLSRSDGWRSCSSRGQHCTDASSDDEANRQLCSDGSAAVRAAHTDNQCPPCSSSSSSRPGASSVCGGRLGSDTALCASGRHDVARQLDASTGGQMDVPGVEARHRRRFGAAAAESGGHPGDVSCQQQHPLVIPLLLLITTK